MAAVSALEAFAERRGGSSPSIRTLVCWYNGNYTALSRRKKEFNSPTNRCLTEWRKTFGIMTNSRRALNGRKRQGLKIYFYLLLTLNHFSIKLMAAAEETVKVQANHLQNQKVKVISPM